MSRSDQNGTRGSSARPPGASRDATRDSGDRGLQPCASGRGQAQPAAGAGGSFGELPTEASDGVPRLPTCHLLTADGDNERIEDQAGRPKPRSPVASVQICNHRVFGAEIAGIVGQAGYRREPFEHPRTAIAPGLSNDPLCPRSRDSQRCGALGGSRRQPPTVAREPSVQGPQRPPQIERALDFDRSSVH